MVLGGVCIDYTYAIFLPVTPSKTLSYLGGSIHTLQAHPLTQATQLFQGSFQIHLQQLLVTQQCGALGCKFVLQRFHGNVGMLQLLLEQLDSILQSCSVAGSAPQAGLGGGRGEGAGGQDVVREAALVGDVAVVTATAVFRPCTCNGGCPVVRGVGIT